MKSLAIVNQTAPFGVNNYRESLDMLLANASYDRPVALFFEGDGVYQLLKNTNANLTGNKDLTKTYGLLDLYDIEEIFVCSDSLAKRGLTLASLHIDVICLPPQQWLEKLATFDHTMSF